MARSFPDRKHPVLAPLLTLGVALVLFVILIVYVSVRNSQTATHASRQSYRNCLKIEQINSRIRSVITEARDKALKDPKLDPAVRTRIVSDTDRVIAKFAASPCRLG